MKLQEAVDYLYQIAVVEGKATSTRRLDGLAQFCLEELARRGLGGAVMEAKLPGGGREKSWDVAWSMDDKPRLAFRSNPGAPEEENLSFVEPPAAFLEHRDDRGVAVRGG